MKYRFKTKPFKHQKKAFIRAFKQQHIGLLWEPGVGKTKPMVDWMSALFMMGELKRAIIFAPLSVLSVWEDEFELHSPLWDWGDVRLTIFDNKMDRVPRIKNKLNICVVNYDLIWRREEILEDQFQPQMAIADESHLCKKPSANRTTALWHYNELPYRAILTGTPTPRSMVDIYAQWKFLNKKRFGTDKKIFVEDYIVYGGYMNKKVMRLTNVDELQKKIKADASRRRKDQCLDLPEEMYQKIPVQLEAKAQEMYNTLAMEFFLELDGGRVVDAENAAVKLLRLQQLTGGWVGTDEEPVMVSQAKIKILRDLLETRFSMDQKVVVFTRFIPEIKAIVALGRRLRIPLYELHGGIKREERTESYRAFQRKQGASLFIAQTEAGGLGITLHAANEAIFYSPSYRLDSYIQDRGRLHRSGQTRKVTYRHLVATGTVDLDIYRSLKEKQNVLDLVMGRPKILVRGIV